MRGHIRKRGENTYQLIWYMGRGEDDRKKYSSKTVHGTKRLAQEELNRILAQIADDDYTMPTSITVTDYFDRWLSEVRLSLKESTLSWYESVWRKHIIPEIGGIELRKLSPLHIQTLYRRLAEKGVSPPTIHAAHRAIGRPLSRAVKWRLIPRSPLERVDPPKAPKREISPLTAEQVMRLLKVSKGTGRYSLYLAAVVTGMRQSELLGLRWSDVDLDRCTITITGTLNRQGERDSTKTAAGTRQVSIPQRLADELRQIQPENPGDQLVWQTSNGTPISHRNLLRQFKNLLQKAGLPETVRFHDLRHTSATLLLSAGVHPKVVQERLGHSRINVTLDTYSHVMPELQRQAAEQLDALLSPESNE